MHNYSKFFYKLMLCVCCALMLVTIPMPKAYAAPEEPKEEQSVFVDGYKLSNEKIIPGEDFTLTISLHNRNQYQTKEVVVDIINPGPVIPAYGTVSQAIGKVKAGETADFSFQYHAIEAINAPALDFQIIISEGDMARSTILRAPIGSDSPFHIITTMIPDKALAGKEATYTTTFKLFGKEPMQNVKICLKINGDIKQTADVGSVERDMTVTKSLSIKYDAPGEYVAELFLIYQDESGKEQEVLAGTNFVNVLSGEIDPANPSIPENIEDALDQQVKEKFNKAKVLVISGILLVLVFLLIVILLKKKK